MVAFEHTKIIPSITRIRACGTDVCMYLVEGSSSALLIDTGYGIGDLRGYVEGLTSKPYRVVLTHGHVDHASGAGQFDEVYLNEADVEVARERTTFDARRASLRGNPILDTDESHWIVPREDRFLPLEEGVEFDLGGCVITSVLVPGHTPGMTVLLDLDDRIAFFGDACGVFTMLMRSEAGTVEEYASSLRHLQTYEPLYDRILRQHGTCESGKGVLEENLELCEEVLAGRDDHAPFEFLGIPGFLAKRVDEVTMRRADGKEANLAYGIDHVR